MRCHSQQCVWTKDSQTLTLLFAGLGTKNCLCQSGLGLVGDTLLFSDVQQNFQHILATRYRLQFLCRVELLSWKPRAFVYHNFLTAEECNHIISTAKPLVSQLPVAVTARRNSHLAPDGTCSDHAPVQVLEKLHVVFLSDAKVHCSGAEWCKREGQYPDKLWHFPDATIRSCH